MLNSLPACIVCGHSYARKRRNLIQKVLFQAVFRCEHCGHETYIRRGCLLFVMFRRYSECPWCGNPDVSRLSSRDRVDPMSRNPLRRILGLFGFRLYHRKFCRLQFFDWRKRESDAKKRGAA
jgi:hypothetical protein